MEQLMDVVKYFLLGANVLLFASLLTTAWASRNQLAKSSSGDDARATGSEGDGPRRALLVTAHPDDESMFFVPLLRSLTTQRDWDVHVLCLSRGNFDGLGDIREREMMACGAFLGLKSDRVHVLEDPQLQDGMQETWDHDHIASLVHKYIQDHSIDAVRTHWLLFRVCWGSLRLSVD
ncbi:hypothetical protein PINS_up013211 [Pythium insidiosum]|nr:hypothetical protein PINS_up013211 [Pythium insidiosum]